MRKEDHSFGSLRSILPAELQEVFYYNSGRILYINLELEFEPRKNKFLVLLDDKEPPLFFLINSESRGIDQRHEIVLRAADYHFLTKKESYLNYDQTYDTYDKVTHPMPTKQELLAILQQEPWRYKGELHIRDAKDLLYGVENEDTAIDERSRKRIVLGLENYIRDKRNA